MGIVQEDRLNVNVPDVKDTGYGVTYVKAGTESPAVVNEHEGMQQSLYGPIDGPLGDVPVVEAEKKEEPEVEAQDGVAAVAAPAPKASAKKKVVGRPRKSKK